MRTLSVPFRVDTVVHRHAGYAMVRMSGLLRLERDQLVVEFSGSESLIAVAVNSPGFGSGAPGATEEPAVRSVAIPLDAIAQLVVKGGLLLRPRLHVEVSRVSALADIPWAEGPRCAMSVARADRDRLRELAAELTVTLADAELRELEAPE